ncbi:MAG: hypothetical protein ACFFDF_04055 [Candidatus Odinarchaeota archaeon]
MRNKKNKIVLLGLGSLIIAFSGVFIALNAFQINFQQKVIDEQIGIMDENRQWAEKITFWEVTGGLGDDIIEGEKAYYDALEKYSVALQTQNLAIFLIIMLSIIIVITIGSLVFKFFI